MRMVQVHLPDELFQRIHEYCYLNSVSKIYVANAAIKMYLDLKDKENSNAQPTKTNV